LEYEGLLLDEFCGNFHGVSRHIGPEGLAAAVTDHFLLGAIGTDLGEVELVQGVTVSHIHISSDLHTVGGVVAVDGDLAALGVDDGDIMVGNMAAADVADLILITILTPVLTDKEDVVAGVQLLADQTFLPVGGAVRVPAAQLVLMGDIASEDVALLNHPGIKSIVIFLIGIVIVSGGDGSNLNVTFGEG